MKKQIFIIDTSAILSGIPINLNDKEVVTVSSVSSEITPGGRDYQLFQYLKQKGLEIVSASEQSIKKIHRATEKTGDKDRLSSTDIEILALALDINKDAKKNAVILTDDYSIQNIAHTLQITFQKFSQRGITKKFKWRNRCPGCNRLFKASIKICPICGTKTKSSIIHKEHIK
jgi:UPF0271 protein